MSYSRDPDRALSPTTQDQRASAGQARLRRRQARIRYRHVDRVRTVDPEQFQQQVITPRNSAPQSIQTLKICFQNQHEQANT